MHVAKDILFSLLLIFGISMYVDVPLATVKKSKKCSNVHKV